MAFGTYVVTSDNHGTVGIDDERRTDHAYVYLAVELLFAICAVQLVHGQVGIRQQREWVVPEKLRTLDRGRPWRDSQFASTRLSPSRDMSR